jgi:GMP synthase-like glutamine amidotransferase
VRCLVLQHIACEPPGIYEDVMLERGWEVVRVELDEGEIAPPWQEVDAVVAMGGPMGAYDEGAFPWLVAEKRLIGDAVRAGAPFFGACLGVQLLASALGALVYPGTVAEVGVLPVTLTPAGRADTVFAGLPPAFPTLQWHGDTFDLPTGAIALASSPAYPNQAFRYGERAYGVQFHLEVDERLAAEWTEVPAYRASADAVLGPGGLERLLADFRAHSVQMQGHARAVFARWCALAEAAGGPPAAA